jgi:hypothetical protein
MAEKFAGEDLLLKILEKSPDAVTDDERDVLKARRSYLTEEQIEKYGLNEEEAEEELETPPMGEAPKKPEEPEKPKKKKGKK